MRRLPGWLLSLAVVLSPAVIIVVAGLVFGMPTYSEAGR